MYDDDGQGSRDFIGQVETSLAKIISSSKQTFISNLTLEKSAAQRGKIIIRADALNFTNDEVRFKISARLVAFTNICCHGVNNPYYIISRARSSQAKDEFVRVYKSTSMNNNTSPMFLP